jgi:hypothetical protein
MTETRARVVSPDAWLASGKLSAKARRLSMSEPWDGGETAPTPSTAASQALQMSGSGAYSSTIAMTLARGYIPGVWHERRLLRLLRLAWKGKKKGFGDLEVS